MVEFTPPEPPDQETPSRPRVSVVVPTYNRDHLIQDAIESILAQDFDDYEIIVVDDGSTDETESVVQEISSPKLRYIKHDRNKGGSAARNTGIEASTGEYIAFLDSDDRWVADKLQRQMDRFERLPKSVGVTFGGCWRHKAGEKFYYPPVSRIRSESWDGSMIVPLLKGSLMTLQTVVVRRECFDVVGGFDESLPRAQDWEMSLRLAREFELDFMNRPLAHSYVQPDSVSMDRPAKLSAHLTVLEKHEDLFRKSPAIQAAHHYKLGTHILDHELEERALPYFLRACRIQPFRPRYYLATFFSLFGNRFVKKMRTGYRELRYGDEE